MRTFAAVEISESLQQAIDGVFNFIPKLIAALAILVIGYFVAKIIGRIVRKALETARIDRVLQLDEIRDHVRRLSPDASLAALIGKIVFYILFAFVLIAALSALDLATVNAFVEDVLAYIPNVIAALLILGIAVALSGLAGGMAMRVMGDTGTGKIVATAVPAFVMVIAVFMVLEQLQVAPEIVRLAFAAAVFSLALGLALAFGLGGRGVAERMLEDAYSKAREQRARVRQDIELARSRRRSGSGAS